MKRLLSLFTLTAILASTLMTLSCNNTEQPNSSTTAGEDAISATTEEYNDLNERAKISDDLEAKDFGGKEFRILHRSNPNSTCRHIEEIVAESEIGEVINDAVFRRNQTVEERFNCKIVSIPVECDSSETQVDTAINKAVKAGDDSFDLIDHHMIYMGQLATTGSFLD